MVVDVCLIGFKRLIVKRRVEILDGLFELLVSVKSQSSFVQYLRIGGLSA